MIAVMPGLSCLASVMLWLNSIFLPCESAADEPPNPQRDLFAPTRQTSLGRLMNVHCRYLSQNKCVIQSMLLRLQQFPGNKVNYKNAS